MQFFKEVFKGFFKIKIRKTYEIHNLKHISRVLIVRHILQKYNYTGVARNFDWERPKREKSYDVSLVT